MLNYNIGNLSLDGILAPNDELQHVIKDVNMETQKSANGYALVTLSEITLEGGEWLVTATGSFRSAHEDNSNNQTASSFFFFHKGNGFTDVNDVTNECHHTFTTVTAKNNTTQEVTVCFVANVELGQEQTYTLAFTCDKVSFSGVIFEPNVVNSNPNFAVTTKNTLSIRAVKLNRRNLIF
jgi:hypothetical protein